MSTLRVPVGDKDHITGDLHAEKVLVEYGDYQCPHCAKAHPFVQKLLKEFKGEVKFVFRNFPLQEVHPMAMMAALATEAAAKQDKFWEMHDIIFEHQQTLSADAILDFAAELGMDQARFGKDLLDKELMNKVERDFVSGLRSGVNGTPTFFLNGQLVTTYNETYESLAAALKG
ncbi:MAG: DsbA family protein [Pseudobacter sp.]|uniref:DsbA family protein n=1 Tax=Pseudobacter sp. TaxID=2045420 RepID=UPI003F7FFCD9